MHRRKYRYFIGKNCSKIEIGIIIHIYQQAKIPGRYLQVLFVTFET